MNGKKGTQFASQDCFRSAWVSEWVGERDRPTDSIFLTALQHKQRHPLLVKVGCADNGVQTDFYATPFPAKFPISEILRLTFYLASIALRELIAFE